MGTRYLCPFCTKELDATQGSQQRTRKQMVPGTVSGRPKITIERRLLATVSQGDL
jgi:hypothetical protein